jgi:hypothetical protein
MSNFPTIMPQSPVFHWVTQLPPQYLHAAQFFCCNFCGSTWRHKNPNTLRPLKHCPACKSKNWDYWIEQWLQQLTISDVLTGGPRSAGYGYGSWENKRLYRDAVRQSRKQKLDSMAAAQRHALQISFPEGDGPARLREYLDIATRKDWKQIKVKGEVAALKAWSNMEGVYSCTRLGDGTAQDWIRTLLRVLSADARWWDLRGMKNAPHSTAPLPSPGPVETQFLPPARALAGSTPSDLHPDRSFALFRNVAARIQYLIDTEEEFDKMVVEIRGFVDPVEGQNQRWIHLHWLTDAEIADGARRMAETAVQMIIGGKL